MSGLLEAARAIAAGLTEPACGVPERHEEPCDCAGRQLHAAIAAEDARALPLGHAFEGAGTQCDHHLGNDRESGIGPCGQPRAAHEPHKPEPIAWAVLCASGKIHHPPWGRPSAYSTDPGGDEVAGHDELGCGPHRAAPLYAGSPPEIPDTLSAPEDRIEAAIDAWCDQERMDLRDPIRQSLRHFLAEKLARHCSRCAVMLDKPEDRLWHAEDGSW